MDLWEELQQAAQHLCADNDWRFSKLPPPLAQFSVVRHEGRQPRTVIANFTPESGVMFLHYERDDESSFVHPFVLTDDGRIRRQSDNLELQVDDLIASIGGFLQLDAAKRGATHG